MNKKKLFLLLLGTGLFISFYLTPKLPQDEAYHNFADCRNFAGIPNTWDVLSNFPFFIVGIWGILLLLRNKDIVKDYFTMYLTFFVGVFLVGLGSSWYHLSPNSSTLVWDRLPMTIAFMALASFIYAERVNKKLGFKLFPWMLLTGLISVVWWALLDDLRFYALVQFVPLVTLPFILWKFPAKDNFWLWCSFLFYGLAKVFEATDHQFFQLTGQMIAGHAIKHVMAAISTLMIVFKVKCLFGINKV